MDKKIEWCFEQHRKSNHLYDNYLPYEFHIRMALQVYQDFRYLLDDELDYFTGEKYVGRGEELVTLREACFYATGGHDILEDLPLSYNDVKSQLGFEAADIIYAVTNEKGKTRKERANDKYYEGIRNTKGAVFVKLCDRIANVQYSKLTKSRMFEMYQSELHSFLVKLGYSDGEIDNYQPMIDFLNKLFKN